MSARATALKLTYFDVPGRAESIRLALVLGEIPFKDERIKHSNRTAFIKLKPALPFGSVPTLTIDGNYYAQEPALLRYVGKLTKTYPTDLIQALKIDSIIDSLNLDINPKALEAAYGRMYVGLDETTVSKLTKHINENIFPRYLVSIDKMVGSEGKFFLENDISIADIHIYNLFKHAYFKIEGFNVERYTNLKNIYDAIDSDKRVVEWNCKNNI